METPDWFSAWQAWLAAAALLGVAELLSLDLVLLMLAAGAVAGMAVALVGLDAWVQVLAALGVSIGALALVRPSIVRRLHAGPDLVLGHEALVGREALVVEQVSSQGGQVRISGELWSARPYDASLTIEPGARVDVLQIKGATALVHEIPELET